MRREVPTIMRYSTPFKLKVIAEIESGKLTIEAARMLYDIRGSATISAWMRKYGKGDLTSKIVRVQMKSELGELKKLKKEKQELESALAQSHLKILCLESLVEATEEHYKIDLKKNFGAEASAKQGRKI